MSHKTMIQSLRHLPNHISVPTIWIASTSKRLNFRISLINPIKKPQSLSFIKMPNILLAQQILGGVNGW